jgi:RNA polymerase sigma-70 factor (ECF subfamily)
MNEIGEFIPTRRSLLSRLKNWDDHESWKLFFETYWKLIFATGMKAGLTKEESEDVVQDTIISVMKSMPTFVYDPVNGSFKSWLLRLTGWRIIDHMRKRQRRICSPKASADTSTETAPIERVADPAWPELEQIWDREWETNLSEAALGRIRSKVDPKHFRIFDLHVLQQWPVSRVAQALRVNIAQVYLVKHRIANLLKKEVAYLRSKPI